MPTLAIIAALLCAGAIATLIGSSLIARRYPPRGRFLTIGGLHQHVVELGGQGPGNGPPLVLVHGAGCNLEDLRALGERLALYHRVILVDRPGQGWSEGSGWASSTPADQAAILRHVLDRLGIARAVIVGHSWGGALAAAFALDYPERVAGLVLLAAPTHPHLHGLTRIYQALSAPVAGWLIAHTLALPLATAAFDIALRGAFRPQPTPRDYVRRSGAFLLLRPAAFLANARDLGGLQDFLARQAERYGAIEAPTVIVTGDHDRIVSARKHAMALAAAIPGAKLVVLSGVGHMPHHAEMDRVVAEIEELVANSE